MKKYLAIAALAVMLTGCGGLTGPTPPATPAPADVAAEQTSLATVPASVGPTQYLNLAVAVSNRWCASYMNTLTTGTNQSDFLSSSASLAGSAATGIATATGAGILPVAIMGIIFPTISEEMKAQGRAATAGADPGAVLSLVQKEQGAYLSALTAPTDTTEADMDITNYALMCQPAGIRSAVLQSTLNATATAQGAPAGTLRATPPNGLHSPPVIIVK